MPAINIKSKALKRRKTGSSDKERVEEACLAVRRLEKRKEPELSNRKSPKSLKVSMFLSKISRPSSSSSSS
jgi:hypothetical protein